MNISYLSQDDINKRYIKAKIHMNHYGVTGELQDYFRLQIKDALESPGSARYTLALDFLRRISRKDTSSTLSEDDSSLDDFDRNSRTLRTISILSKLGCTDEILKSIISLLFDKKYHYQNIAAKIYSMKGSIFTQKGKDQYFVPNYKAGTNFSTGVGGMCQNLAVAFKDSFSKTILHKLIKIDPNASIKVVYGYDRTHFNTEGSAHVFCNLTFAGKSIIIDPSFGEIVYYNISGYRIIGDAWNHISANDMDNEQNYEKIKIGKNKGDAELIFLGLLQSDSGYKVSLFFNDIDGRIIPGLCFTKNDQNRFNISIENGDVSFHHNSHNSPPPEGSLKKEVENICVAFREIIKDIQPPSK